MSELEYSLLGEENETTYHRRNSRRRIKIRTKKKWLYILTLLTIACVSIYYVYEKHQRNKLQLVLVKGESRKDPYGVELNGHILDGMYCMEYDNTRNRTMDEWSLYTPPCPYLRPVHYPDSIINPKCEESSLQIVNFNNNEGIGMPYSLPLNSIINQMKKWNSWEKKNINNTLYGYKKVSELVGEEYYPFDYGYNGDDTSQMSDKEYYTQIVNSRMDEVPDPRRRRLFSFILFNTEFDLLDLYISEYYEIIDYFVIYESNSTFNGNPKPLYFTRALLETDRYEKFKDKLIPLPLKIVVDEDNGHGKGFPREHVARRELIAEGLKAVHARHGDLFMHGDLDEMAKPHILARLKKCGGWEHLQAGIGGGPKSFKEGNVKSYIYDPTVEVSMNNGGGYQVDYDRDRSIGFLNWFYEYSFGLTQDDKIGTISHPNIAIFDARRSLGQFNERKNRNTPQEYNRKRKREENEDEGEGEGKKYDDPLLDPNFDPYQGYLYTDNTNDRKTGKGFLGEFVRFTTSFNNKGLSDREKPTIWSGAWHLSSFFPTINHILNKVYSYSHFNEYEVKEKEKLIEDLKYRIKNNYYLYGEMNDKNRYFDITPAIPESYRDGYDYHFDYKYWKAMAKTRGEDEASLAYMNMVHHEIPNQVWKNPICYSYMIDRDYGIDKKLWWEVIPKSEWKTVHFEQLETPILNELIPSILSDTFKKEMLETMAKETYDQTIAKIKVNHE